MIVLLLTGCIEFSIDPVDSDGGPDRVPVEDSFRQTALPAVDVLFVIDNTSSMSREQIGLSSNLTALTDTLADEDVRWHAGVVTTDMTTDDPGWLRGTPWLVTSSMADAEEVFADSVRVGTDGSDPEAGLAAAVRALELSVPGRPNAGFRRPDAALHVVFVSDSDDQSDTILGSDPVGVFLDALALEESNTGLPATASAIVGDLPVGCASATGDAAPGTRYREAALAGGGRTMSICNPDYSQVLAGVGTQAIAYSDTFELQAEPVPASLRVTVDGVLREDGWSYDVDAVAVVFEQDRIPRPRASIIARYLIEVAP